MLETIQNFNRRRCAVESLLATLFTELQIDAVPDGLQLAPLFQCICQVEARSYPERSSTHINNNAYQPAKHHDILSRNCERSRFQRGALTPGSRGDHWSARRPPGCSHPLSGPGEHTGFLVDRLPNLCSVLRAAVLCSVPRGSGEGMEVERACAL